jgi:hypothetical protein
LHEGAVVANYPYDGFTDHSNRVNGTRNPSPDDTTFMYLAKLYARAHKTMAKSKVSACDGAAATLYVRLGFLGGLQVDTFAAEWYSLRQITSCCLWVMLLSIQLFLPIHIMHPSSGVGGCKQQSLVLMVPMPC